VGILQPLEDQGCLVEVGVEGGAVAPVREAGGRLGASRTKSPSLTSLDSRRELMVRGLQNGVHGGAAVTTGEEAAESMNKKEEERLLLFSLA